jgi:predicted metal-binding membrane protein
MGMPLTTFLLMWIVMMAAMMFPAVAPVAILWLRGIMLSRLHGSSVRRIAGFVLGYLGAWSVIGVIAYFAFGEFETAILCLRGSAKYLGASIFALAGMFQFTQLKDVCLRHCRSPLSALAHYTSFRGWALDFRVGLHHGLYCAGCCWGLMLVLLVVGVMNIGIMAALTTIITLEKLSARGPLLARIAGAIMVVLAGVTLVAPELFPGLRAP